MIPNTAAAAQSRVIPPPGTTSFSSISTVGKKPARTRSRSQPPRRRGPKSLRNPAARASFASQCDANAIVDRAHYDQFRDLLAAEKPDAVFTHWPVDNHADHRAISNLTYDAWNKLGRNFALYFYEVSDGEDTQMFRPDSYVDITSVEALKRAACYAHASQSPDRYYALQTQVARFRGLESGYALAEAFARHPRSHGPNLLPL